jgi:hypothetical protein
MDQSQRKSYPAKDDGKQNPVNPCVNIARKAMPKIHLVLGHPFVLQGPISDEMKDDSPHQQITGG